MSKRFRISIPFVLTVVASVACDDPLALQPAFDASFVDTVTVFALRGTPISAPSGYDVVNRAEVRTDRGDNFDFTFDIDEAGVAQIFPSGALGLPFRSGIIFSDQAFDDIVEPPTEGFSLDTALTVAVDSVFIVRSRPDNINCPFFIGSLPRYGKFEVLEIDMVERLVRLKTLVNINCGYRDLAPGFPTS